MKNRNVMIYLYYKYINTNFIKFFILLYNLLNKIPLLI